MAKRFDGKVALVTGAARGIGLATARAFAREGAKVMLADVSLDVAEEAVEDIRSSGGVALCVQADVADYDACQMMVAKTVEQFGGLHIGFNNAGIALMAPIEQCSLQQWRRVLDVNLTGVFQCIQSQVPAMKECGGGAIVNTASITSFIASESMCSYVTSKHGVAGLTKAAALDLIGYGIRVNAVCPGFTHTALLDPAAMSVEMVEQMERMTPIRRVASADEVAQAVLYLASDEASYVVGTLLTVDGGVVLR